jgi:hypothetical protein
MAPANHFPPQRRVSRPENISVQFGSWALEARDATPYIVLCVRCFSLSFDDEIPHDVDTLARRSMLYGDPRSPNLAYVADRRTALIGNRPARTAEQDVSQSVALGGQMREW